LFREREVENLHKLIYEGEQEIPDERQHDTNRYDVHTSKLDIFKNANLKKMLKTKFVTG
jgi:hypothetical protein